MAVVLGLRLVLSSAVLAFAVQSIGMGAAQAAPEGERSPSAEGAPPGTSNTLRAGVELLASAGYGAATSDVGDAQMEPYAASFGLDLGYTFSFGFRVGAVVGYGFGRSVTHHRESRFGEDLDYEVDTSNVNVAMSLGYDVPLKFLVLRYTLNFGAIFMRYDFGGVPAESVFGDVTANSPAAGFVLAPGLTLLWPHGVFECGVGFDYFVQANWAIPPGFLGELLVGVKL